MLSNFKAELFFFKSVLKFELLVLFFSNETLKVITEY